MSLDLRLLPCEHWYEENGRLSGMSSTVLELGSLCDDAWDAFQAQVKPHLVELPAGHDLSSYVGARVPAGFHKGEPMFGTIRAKDAYGSAYEVVAAQHLLPWLTAYFQYDGHLGKGPYQTAIVAYVRALPPDTKIVLDWH